MERTNSLNVSLYEVVKNTTPYKDTFKLLVQCVQLFRIISSRHKIEMGEIGVIKFKVGQAIRVEYTNPSDGWVRIDLCDEKGNVVLVFNP